MIEKESDLYAPLKLYLEAQGYDVQGEVKGCDLVAVRGDDFLVVEMKKSFNLKLLVQATTRQKVCSSVYMAFPVTKSIQSRRRLNEIKALAKRLHLGLMLVHDRPSGLVVEVPLLPDFQVFRTDVKAQKALAKEFFAREHSVNTGGIVKQRIITAHREKALNLVAFLKLHGPSSVATLKDYTGDKQIGSLLSVNHYGWFERVARGTYSINENSQEDFRKYDSLLSFYTNRASAYVKTAE